MASRQEEEELRRKARLEAERAASQRRSFVIELMRPGPHGNCVPREQYDRLMQLFRGTCEEAMELLKNAPGAAAMFDPEYLLGQAGFLDDPKGTP